MSARSTLLPGLLLVLAAAGCESARERVRTHLAEGERAFREKNYDHAVDLLSRGLVETGAGPQAARAFYVRGMARALLGQRTQAYADLERAARDSTNPELAWQPDAVLGVLYFEDQRWAAAARALERATDRMSRVPPQDALLYRIGLCHERGGRWSAAQAPYRHIVSRFPRGVYAEAAKRRLLLKADHFAVQCGVFSRRENARRLVAQLAQDGLSPYVRREQRRGADYYVVLVGRYRVYTEALCALARIRGYLPKAVLWP